jgi:hypothetical protein
MFAVAILLLFTQLNTVSAACNAGSGTAGTLTNSDCDSTAGAAEGFTVGIEKFTLSAISSVVPIGSGLSIIGNTSGVLSVVVLNGAGNVWVTF